MRRIAQRRACCLLKMSSWRELGLCGRMLKHTDVCTSCMNWESLVHGVGVPTAFPYMALASSGHSRRSIYRSPFSI